MINQKKRFALFYPSQELGGAELLISRLAEELSERGNCVTVLDSDKGIIRDNIKNKGVFCLTVSCDHPVSIDSDYLIVFASHLSSLGRFVNSNDNCRVLFWSVHPLNSIYLFPRLGEWLFQGDINYLKIVNRILFSSEVGVRSRALNELIRANAFFCMDGENSRVLNLYYGLDGGGKFIPVPVPISGCPLGKRDFQESGIITIAWYGRLCDFKVHALVYLIYQLKFLERFYRIKLLVIGDGPLKSKVERAIAETGLSVCFKGTMTNAAAQKLLYEESDIVFAMGTAALESGAIGIPTVLVDASYKPIDFNYGFQWLYQTKEFTLGRFIKKSDAMAGVSLDALLRDACDDYKRHSVASFDYVRSNHDISNVVNLLERYCEESEMSLAKFIRVTNYKGAFLLRAARYVRKLLGGKE